MRIASWTLLALPFVAVGLVGGVGDEPFALVSLAVAAVALLAAVAGSLRAAPRDALALALAWSVLALAQIGWSAGVDAAIDGAAAVLVAAATFLVASTAVARADRERWLVAFGLGGAAVGAIALVMATETRASFPLGNPNHLAGWLLVPAALALAGLCSCAPNGRSHGWTILWFGVFGLAGAGIAASGSRGGLLAAVAAAAALALLHRSPRRGAVVIGGAFLLGVLALGVGPLLLPDAVPWARGGNEFSPGIRWMVYGASMHAAFDAAPLGTGIGGFEWAYAPHRPPELHYLPRHAHNEALHGLVELGLPLLVLAVATSIVVLRRLPTPHARRRSLAVWGSGAAAFAVAAHSLVDSPLHVPAVTIAIAALLGLAWPSRGPGRSLPLTRAVLASLALLLAGISVTSLVALHAAEQAGDRLAIGDFRGAEAAARQGLVARPWRLALWRQVAEAAEHAEALSGGGVRALDRALVARNRALEVGPDRAALRIERAALQLRRGAVEEAVADVARASALDPISPAPHLARARVLLAAARPEAAALALRDAVERHPLAAVRVIADLVLATGDPRLADLAVPEVPRAMVGAGRALTLAGYPREAAGVFERALDLEPTDARTAVETARSWVAVGATDRAAAVLSRTLDRVPGDRALQAELERTLARARGGSS